MIWLFLGIGCALLFGAIGVRLFRRVRNARRAPQDADDTPTARRRADRPEGTRRSGHQVTDQPTDPPVDEVDEQSTLLSNSAVMAAGTVVSRLSGFVRAAAAGRRARQAAARRPVQRRATRIPNMLYILLAGGIFNAVLVPQLVRAMQQRPRRRRRLHQPDHHRWPALFLVAVTRAAGGRGAVARRLFRRPDVRQPGWPRSATR